MDNTPVEKVWGTYNTFKNPKELENLDEISLWIKISELSDELFWTDHDREEPWKEDATFQEISDLQYNLEYLMYQTKKFGIEFDKEPSSHIHVEKTNSYNKWYNFWHKHFQKMTREEYNQFLKDKFIGNDIKKYLPQNTWNCDKEQIKIICIKKYNQKL